MVRRTDAVLRPKWAGPDKAMVTGMLQVVASGSMSLSSEHGPVAQGFLAVCGVLCRRNSPHPDRAFVEVDGGTGTVRRLKRSA
jgi:hypothetical protein